MSEKRSMTAAVGWWKVACCQRGQAATEFLIAAIYVLVPLFLIVPLVGRYIDIKQSLVSQARFESWEYTAWFMHRDRIMELPKNHSTMRAAVRPWQETRLAGQRIYLADITVPDYPRKDDKRVAANPLWIDHRGNSLLAGNLEDALSGSLVEERTPNPSGHHFIDDVLQGLADVAGWVKKLLHFEGQKAGFDAIDTHGYFHSRLELAVRSPEQVIPLQTLGEVEDGSDRLLTFHAGGSVLAGSWQSGSSKNTEAEVKGLVLTSMLAPVSDTVNPILDRIRRALGGVHIGPVRLDIELPELPSFGYVKQGLVPYEHLEKEIKGHRLKAGELREYHGLSYYRVD